MTDNKVMEIVSENSSELDPVFNAAIIKYDVNDAAIAKLREEYKVQPVTNTKELKENAASIAVIRTIRVNVDKRRKALKKDVNEYGKKVQNEANRLTEQLVSIEKPLNDAKEAYEAKKEAIAAEKKHQEEARIQTIKDKLENIKRHPVNFTSSTVPLIKKSIENLLFDKDDFDYQEFAQEALQVKTLAISELQQLQTKREEQDKQEKEAEEKRIELEKQEAELKVEREKLEKERVEAEKKVDEYARLNKIQQDKLAKERQKIADRETALQAKIDAKKAKEDAVAKAKQKTIKQTALLTSTKPLYEFDQEQLIQSLIEQHDGVTIEHLRNAAPLMLLTLLDIWDDWKDRVFVDMDNLAKVISYVKDGADKE